MKLDTGMIIVIGMVLLFYLRLIIIQWGKADRYNRAKNKGKKSTSQNYASLKFKFNWLLIGIGAGIIILGTVMKATGIFGPVAGAKLVDIRFNWHFRLRHGHPKITSNQLNNSRTCT